MQALSGSQPDGGAQLAASLSQNQAPKSDIRANAAEAARLYQRGIAAARGGQRRVAAGLLTRSVQLDPRNERAWLWLSGVLDDPHQIAFCLRSVLKLNPTNERAQQGLRWLEERQLLNGAPKPSPVLDVQLEEPLEQRQAREHGESWWVNWRRSRRDMNRARLLLWSVPLVLLCLALILYETFAFAVAQSNQPRPVPAVLSAAVVSETGVRAPAVLMLESETASIREVRIIAYMSMLEPIRQQLRNAVDNYRNATGQPGGASVGHVAAAQQLRASVEQAHTTLQEFTPPQELQSAHDNYIQGLELELEALDAILEFYGSFRVELANRAALRFQEAGVHFDRARAMFNEHTQQMGAISTVSAHTPR